MQKQILNEFKQCIKNSKSNDISNKNIVTFSIFPDINREQILFQSYILEKRGKTFGSVQYRKLIIQNRKLYQQSTKEKKQLSIPSNLITEIKYEGRKWNQQFKNYPVRMLMEFNDRSPCYIYFKNLLQCNQIKTFIISLRLKQSQTFFQKSALKFKKSVVARIGKNIQSMIKNADKIQLYQRKRKGVLQLLQNYSKVSPFNFFFQNWLNKTQREEKLCFVKNLKIRYKSIKFPQNIIKLNVLTLKLWSMGKCLFEEKCAFNRNSQENLINTSNLSNTSAILNSTTFYNPSNNFIEITNCALKQDIVIELIDSTRKWRSQKLQIYDLWRSNRKILNIVLTATQPYPSVTIQFLIDMENKNTNYPEIYKPIQFSPDNYTVIDQIVGCDHNDNPNIQFQTYKKALEQLEDQRIDEFSPFRLKKYIQGLQIQQLINKCYANQPFNKLNKNAIKSRGTYIYRYYINRSKDLKYYDVQKLIWKYGYNQHRRFLNALKNFDENPRINFSENLYYFIVKILTLVERSSRIYWNTDLFEQNLYGRQSIAFFICLVLIYKTLSNFFLYESKGLSQNSLLFHYICKNYQKQIYSKLTLIQFNIQALFGLGCASIFSELFDGEIYYKILDAVLIQCRLKKYEYNLVLIGVFLVLLDKMNNFQTIFEGNSNVNFIFGMKLCAKSITDTFEFLYSVDQYIQRIKKDLLNPKYLQIRAEMESFYKQNSNSNPVQVNQLISEFYTIFTSYSHKDQMKEHELHLCLNKIEINAECPKITFYLYQNKSKLFEKEFINCAFRQLNFTVILKLACLDEIIIAIYQDQKLYTQFTSINIRNMPSNYAFQHVLPLESSKSSILDEDGSYICFQTFIKDDTQNLFYVNKIPQKYINYFYDTQDMKQEIISLNKFTNAFRMVENNYNLLYSRFGWYNNYYLVPEERLLESFKIQKNDLKKHQAYNLQKIFKINRYSRCVFGRAYFQNKKEDTFTKAIKNGIIITNTFRRANAQKNRNLFLVNQLLNIYPLQTIKTKSNCYFDFYCKILQLPLIKYLSYNPKLYCFLPELSLEIRMNQQRGLITFCDYGEPFQIFNQNRIQEIQNSITFRKLKLKLRYTFKFPSFVSNLDNFLFHLRLNIFQIMIRQEMQDLKSLIKWPNRIIARSSELGLLIDNIQLQKFWTVIIETKSAVILEFKEFGKQKLKYFSSYGYIKSYKAWRRIEVICEINALYKYYLVEEQITRRKLLLKEDKVILGEGPIRLKISCGEADLTDKNSALYKKIQKLS